MKMDPREAHDITVVTLCMYLADLIKYGSNQITPSPPPGLCTK